MDPMKVATWKSDFKFLLKLSFLTLVPLATFDHLDLVSYILVENKTRDQSKKPGQNIGNQIWNFE
jgi:hypothetical protein